MNDSPAAPAPAPHTDAIELANLLPAQSRDPDLAVGGSLVKVRIVDLPLPVVSRAQQWSDELTREFTHIATSRRRGDEPLSERPLPARLVSIVEMLSAGYGPFTVEQDAVLADAVASGAATLPELVYRVPASAGPAAAALRELMEEADAYCQQGEHLLTLTSPQDVTAFRRWFLNEFERQCAGAEPVPWPAHQDNTDS
jgi:hypothetical protein